MADIALSAYLEEINTLIDEGRPGEAIIHARHILENYPRQLDTYRLLAKALLEQGEFLDAGDLFQRVLSAYPDDFIAHAGLVIVRKEENKLDEALWHMERAFEIEPYNAAIRAELTDLYERRDGTAPERLALTRAALARLYVNGAMYQQAEAELRTILAEFEQRIDLRVLLAEALWRDEQRVDAAELCLDILKQLPNCIDANAILAEVWLLTGRTEEAQPYLERLQALTQISQADLSGDSPLVRAFQAEGAQPLPDKLLLERLPEQVALGITAGNGVDWAEDVSLEADEIEDDFDWLRALESSEQVEAGAPASAQPETTAGEPEDAWTTGEEEVAEVGTAEAPDRLRAFDDDEADLADASAWLNETGEMEDLAGEETDWEEWLEADAVVENTDREEMPDSLAEPTELEETAAAGEEEALPGWLLEEVEAETDAADSLEIEFGERLESVVPDDEFELEEVLMGTSEERKNRPEDEAPETEPEATPAEDLDWLNELAAVDDDEVPSPGAEGDAVPPAAEDIPDWLREDVEVEVAPADSLDWLEESQSEGTPHVDEPVVELPESQMGDWVPDEEQVEADEDLSWLDQIAAGEGEAIEEPPTVSWPEEGEDEEVEAVTPSALESSVGPETADDGDDDFLGEAEEPDWLGELEEPTATEAGPATAFEAEGDEEEPDWLRDLDVDEEEEADWLSAMVEEEPASFAAETGPAADFEAEAGEEELDWLEDLETGGEEQPTVFGEEAPESEAAEEAVGPEPLPAAEEAGEELPDWLDGIETEEEELERAAEDSALRAQLMASEGVDVEEEVPEAETVEAAIDDFVDTEAEGEASELEWLQDLDQEESVPEMAAEDQALRAEMADAGTAPAGSEELEAAEVPEDLEEAMAWLEQLAAQQGAPLDKLPSVQEADLDNVPAWLREVADEDAFDELLDELPDDREEALDYLETLADESEGEEVEFELPALESEAETSLPEPEEDLAWMETLVEAGEEGAVAQEPVAGGAEEEVEEAGEAPEDLEEAMVWLEQLAAQQGAPLDELPSVQQGAAEMPEEDEAWEDERPAAELSEEVEAEPELAAVEEDSDLAAALAAAEAAEPEEEVDEAMIWLDRWTAQEQALPSEEEVQPGSEKISALSAEIPDDPEKALAWLEQLAGRPETSVSTEPAYAEERMPVVEEPVTPAVPQDVVEARVEAEMIQREWVEEKPAKGEADADELEAESGTDTVTEEEMLADIPEDPDEAMAWLEQLAARQGASLDELPSVQEMADEVAIPEWLAQEVEEAAAEEAAQAAAQQRRNERRKKRPRAKRKKKWPGQQRKLRVTSRKTTISIG